MSAMSRANKIISRSRSRQVRLALDDAPIEAGEVGRALLSLTARAQACGIDPEQALRDAVRELERQVQAAESGV
jgi:XTP/dITP diphosphohydrolase